MPTLLVLVGIPGSGKSTLSQHLVQHGWSHINQDALGSRPACEDACRAALRQGLNVVVDRCNHDSFQRSHWVRLARQAGRVRVVALQLLLPVGVCKQRALARVGHPTLGLHNAEGVIDRFYHEFEPADTREGFDRVMTATSSAEVDSAAAELLAEAAAGAAAAQLQGGPGYGGGRGQGHGRGPRQGAGGRGGGWEAPSPGWGEHRQGAPQEAWGQGPAQAQQGSWGQQRPWQEQPTWQQQGSWQQQAPPPQSSWQQQPQHWQQPAGPRPTYQSPQEQGWQQPPQQQVWPQQAPSGPGWQQQAPSGPGWQQQAPNQQARPQPMTGPPPHWGPGPSGPPVPPSANGHANGVHANGVHANGDAGGGPSHRPGTAPGQHRHKDAGSRGGAEVATLRRLYADPASKVPYDAPRAADGACPDAARPDPRPILLFDLNGTLTSHTAARKSSGITRLRPGTEHLARLKPHFRLGVYTSSTLRTTHRALQQLEAAAGQPLFERGLVLHREHTRPAPMGHVDAGGDPWDTLKPLAPYFACLHRLVLVDDDAYKACEGESGSMLQVPRWEEGEEACPVLPLLAELLLERLGHLPQDADVRGALPELSARLVQAAEAARARAGLSGGGAEELANGAGGP
ncbi:hypothetical protein HYH03_004154 [Edaphochlamys debaryana]|uniref:FCP1 homology domain-containing protein n=1 Tax=Edaphochlamys debaryana TaxID=47281 RepID=A0A835YAU3_9CHLO|nr:hypothetical protein HYH03_004154 [Edaphochlamys debaryana]|eukprot:KAG2497888.1 hypothetical protein HYH03_004154 [Edaphochlamys debaryana]